MVLPIPVLNKYSLPNIVARFFRFGVSVGSAFVWGSMVVALFIK